MRNRIMAWGLTFAVTIGLIAGCSNKQDNSKKSTVATDATEIVNEDQAKYYYDFGDIDQAAWVKSVKKADISDDTILILTDKEYRDDIIEKVNESLADDGCSYDIVIAQIPWEYTMVDEISDFIKYVEENGIQPDIVCSVYGSITNSMPKEMVYDMTDYLSTGKGKSLKKAIDDKYWTLMEEDGHWYGVGSVVERCEGWIVDRETMIDLDLTVEDLAKPLEELEPVFEKVKEQKPELIPFIYGWSVFETDVPVTMYDSSTYIGNWSGDESGKVENLMDDNRTYEFIKALNTYGEKGYAKMVDDMSGRDDYFMMAAWNVTPLMRADSLDMWSSSSGRTLIKIPYGDEAGNISIQSSVILSDSDHIEQSLDFLTRVNTTKEISELLLYGIIDKDYITDGNTYQTDKEWADMGLYSIPLGNLSICTNMEPFMDPEASTVRSDIDKLRVKMEAYDFVFDTSAVEKQYEAVTEIYSSLNRLYSLYDFNNHESSGCSNWEEYYEKFNSDLKAAGIDDIVAEMNRQLGE